MSDQVHVRADPSLVDAARQGAGLPASVTVGKVVRYALALLAGWPDSAARSVARIPGWPGETAQPDGSGGEPR